MQRFFKLIRNLKTDPHGKNIRFLLIGSFSIIFCTMLIAAVITYKSGADIVLLGEKTHQKSHPIILHIINLKLIINENHKQITTWLAKPNKEMIDAYRRSNYKINIELEKLIKLSAEDNTVILALSNEINSNQSLIQSAELNTNNVIHWENAQKIIQNHLNINFLIDQLIKNQTLQSQQKSLDINKQLSQIIKINISVMFFALLFGLIVIFRISKYVVNLLKELNHNKIQADSARSMAEAKTLELDNTSRVLIKTNRNLVNSIENLNNTRDQLVQNEKMASLGELVAGVAHEINTPIGIGVTAASHLQDSINAFKRKFESGQITKFEFSDFLNDASEGSNIMLNNLERAAKLINSFKRVAVDQTSESKRHFNLKETIEETLLSLKPKLKKTNIKIDLTCPETLNLDSYPGAYSQIISNLITNSLIHGYQTNNNGVISIAVVNNASNIELKYSDDGVGVSDENKDKIFNPFFTTRRGDGGSGLGLHLVFNIVTQKLNGEISIDTTEKYGLAFIINIPIDNY